MLEKLGIIISSFGEIASMLFNLDNTKNVINETI